MPVSRRKLAACPFTCAGRSRCSAAHGPFAPRQSGGEIFPGPARRPQAARPECKGPGSEASFVTLASLTADCNEPLHQLLKTQGNDRIDLHRAPRGEIT